MIAATKAQVRSLSAPNRLPVRLAVIALMGGILATRLSSLPDAGPGIYLLAGPAMVALGYVILRGPRWSLVALVGCTLFGLYRRSVPVGPVDIRLTDLAYLSLLVWAVRLRGRGRIERSDVGQWFIGLLILVLGLTLFTVLVNGEGGVLSLLVSWARLAVTVSLVWLVPYAIRTPEARRSFFLMVLYLCTASVAFILVQTAFRSGFGERAAGALGPNAVGLLAGLVVVGAIHAPLRQPSHGWVMGVVGILGLLGTRSIGAIIATALPLGIYGLTMGNTRSRASKGQLLAPMRLLLLTVGAVGVITTLRPLNLPGSSAFDYSTTAHRLVEASAGYEIFRRHPVMGVGWQRSNLPDVIGDPEISARLHRRFPDVNPEFFPDTNPGSVHNAYVQILAESGLIGILTAGVALVAVRRRVWAVVAASRAGPDAQLARCAVLLLVVILIWWNDNPLFGAEPETVLAATLLGVLASCRRGAGIRRLDAEQQLDAGVVAASLGRTEVEPATDKVTVGAGGQVRDGSPSLMELDTGHGHASGNGSGPWGREAPAAEPHELTDPSTPPDDVVLAVDVAPAAEVMPRPRAGPDEPGTAPPAAPGSKSLAGVTVLHIGHFDPSYARNRIMAKALRRAGAEVIAVTDERSFSQRTPGLLGRGAKQRTDLILVGFPGHGDLASARAIGAVKRAPVIFDPLVSLYETAVEDRNLVPEGSGRALRYLTEDRLACRLADLVLLDTEAHISYFVERIGAPREKFRRAWVGADDEVMYPRPARSWDGFRVLFYGTFIPLHGLEHIVTAAHLLERSGEHVEFRIVGSGQTYGDIRRLAEDLGTTSIEFLGRRPFADLPELIATSDVCLGVFGTSGKAGRVIPNKIFDALAMAKPVITADTPAVREVLVHQRDAWLCPAGDPQGLADAILELKSDPSERERVAAEGHRLYEERFSPQALSRDLAAIVGELLSR